MLRSSLLSLDKEFELVSSPYRNYGQNATVVFSRSVASYVVRQRPEHSSLRWFECHQIRKLKNTGMKVRQRKRFCQPHSKPNAFKIYIKVVHHLLGFASMLFPQYFAPKLCKICLYLFSPFHLQFQPM
jgi:hypothetical protein